MFPAFFLALAETAKMLYYNVIKLLEEFMTRLVFCDLDGTLLPRGAQTLDPQIISHIERLCDKGIVFAVASGRSYEQLYRIFRPVAHKIVFVCLDGALVLHRGCVLYKKFLCKHEAARLLSLCDRGTVFGRTETAEITENTPSTRIPEIINRLGSEVFKVALYGASPKSDIARICYNRDGICEYVSASADKGEAARAVMSKFRIDPSQTAAVGDGENDLPLLRTVGAPFAAEGCEFALSREFPSAGNILDWLSKF